MMNSKRGFTLVEVSITLVMLGILAAIVIPNFIKFQDRAVRASCVSNQRHIVEYSTLYSIESGVESEVINVTELHAGDYIGAPATECPDSDHPDLNDYTITIEDHRVISVVCNVRPDPHQWTGPA